MNNSSTKPFLGLSFQPEQLCLVEIQDGLIQALATREMVQPFGIESFHTGGQFLDNQIEILQDLYRGMGAKGKDIGVVLDGGMVLLKKIPIALGLQEEMIREHIMWEAEQLLVSLLDEYIVEYQRLPFQTPLGNPFYVLILVRKRVMEGVQSLIEKCGFTLKEVDVDVFSIIRTLLVNYDINPDETFVLVDVQRQYFSFIFIRQREYLLSYRISLQEDGSVSQIKQNSDTVNVLLKELRRLVFGHRIGRGIDDLDRIFLMGGDNIQKVSHELSSAVSVPLEIINPFRRIEVSQSVKQSKEFNDFPEKFVGSVGAILRNTSQFSE